MEDSMDSTIEFTVPFVSFLHSKFTRWNEKVLFKILDGKKLQICCLGRPPNKTDSWFLKNIKIDPANRPDSTAIGSDGLSIMFMEKAALQDKVLRWLNYHIEQYNSSKNGNDAMKANVKANGGSTNSAGGRFQPHVPPPLPSSRSTKKAQMRVSQQQPLKMPSKSSGIVSRYPSDKPAVSIDSPEKRRRDNSNVYTQSPLKNNRDSSFGRLQQEHPSRSQDDGTSPQPGEKRSRTSLSNQLNSLFTHGDEATDRFDSPPPQRPKNTDETNGSRANCVSVNKSSSRYVNPLFTKNSASMKAVYNNCDQLKADATGTVSKMRANGQLPPQRSSTPAPSTPIPLRQERVDSPQRVRPGSLPAPITRPNTTFTSTSRTISSILNVYGPNRSASSLTRSSTSSSLPVSYRDFDSNKTQYAGGVKNLGNTCYMGSVLQAILNLHPRYRNLLNVCLTSIISTNGNTEDGLLLSLYQLMNMHKEKKDKFIKNDSSQMSFTHDSILSAIVKLEREHSLDPLPLKTALAQRSNKYRFNSQQDAQEFLVEFMDEVEVHILRFLKPKFQLMPSAILATMKEESSVVVKHEENHEKVVESNVDYMDTDDNHHEAQSMYFQTPSPVTISHVPRTEHGDILKEDEEAPETTLVDNKDVNVMVDDVIMDTSDAGNNNGQLSSSSSLSVSSSTAEQQSAMNKLTPTTFLFESLMQLRMSCEQCGHQHDPRIESYKDFAIDLQQYNSNSENTAADANNSNVGIAGRSLRSSTLSQRPLDLHQLLRGFLQPESRDLHCPHCGDKNAQVKISKQMLDLAPVLVLQLKRFEYCRKQNNFRKVDTEVILPKVLDLVSCGWRSINIDYGESSSINGGSLKGSEECIEQFTKLWSSAAQESESTSSHWMEAVDHLQNLLTHARSNGHCQQMDGEYHLAAVVRHAGSTVELGHYVCDVQTSIDGKPKWLRYNDSYVTEIDEEQVLGAARGSTPYLLFYQFVPNA